MRMPSTQRLRVTGVTLVVGVPGRVTAPGWADERQAAMSESEWAARGMRGSLESLPGVSAR